ncbi:MAG: periplasmic heavy metal sensor, partial [Alphaproteobacteria bacterium]|nr:periplasmic heavy metal sensor [Alphaproteobacteria bacterium]
MATKTSLVLIASLVLNAALIGVTGGRLLNQPEPKPSQQFARYGPPSDVVMAAWAQLPEPDRIELRKQMREEWALMKSDRERLHEGGRAVHEAALLEPFDETRLRNQLIVFQQREQMMQRRA